MTDEEKFLFDLQGFIVLPGVLTRAECEALIAEADAVWPAHPDDGPFRRCEQISKWGDAFRDLMDHPKVLPYLVELIGRRLRIDHDYCIFMREGAEGLPIHGGPRRIETDHWYYYADGVMRNGLTVATWNLSDAPEGAGGFICVPGSHKTNFMMNLPEEVRADRRRVPWVVQPELAAGDVLIFTEALMHGTRAWQAPHERRTLLFKYSPPHSSWRIEPYRIEDYPGASEQQKRLMAPPSVEHHPPVLEE